MKGERGGKGRTRVRARRKKKKRKDRKPTKKYIWLMVAWPGKNVDGHMNFRGQRCNRDQI